MRTQTLFVIAALATVLFRLAACHAESPGMPGEKIELGVLYVGSLAAPRGPDFVEFLEKHFTRVGKEKASEKFKEQQAEGYDVVIIDTFGLRVSDNYARPTMTLRAPGAHACANLRLKTGYL